MSETALFSGKFTQLTKILHDRRSRQIPSLALSFLFSDLKYQNVVLINSKHLSVQTRCYTPKCMQYKSKGQS